MDDWHRKLAKELVQGTPTGTLPDAAVAAAAALEIAFGHARSAITYVLELSRAHRIPATGNVTGDDLWLQLGEGRIRFTLNRRDAHVLVTRPGQPDARLGLGQGDLGTIAQESIDALVTAWRAGPDHYKIPTPPPRDFDDEPTKG